MLSSVDQKGGVKLFREIREIDRENGMQENNRTTYVKPRTCEIDGNCLERWFVKTSVNLFIISKKPYKWYSGDDATKPPEELVKWAFGQGQPVGPPKGLYCRYGVSLGQKIRLITDEVSFIPIVNDGTLFGGGFFQFQGLQFLIWFENTFPVIDPSWLYRHGPGTEFRTSNEKTTHKLTFKW